MIEQSEIAPQRRGLGWPDVEWSIPAAIGVFAGGIAGSLVGVVALVAFSSETLTSIEEELTPFATAVALLAQIAGNFLVLFALMAKKRVWSPAKAVGLTLRPRESWGIAAGFGAQLLIAVTLTYALDRLIGGEIPEQAAVTTLAASSGFIEKALIILGAVILGPIIEEIIFRGMLLTNLARRMNVHWAVMISSAVFAGVHLLDPNALYVIPGLFAIGVMLGYMAVRSESLSLPIFGHIGVNLTAAILIIGGEDIVPSSEALATLLGF